MERRNAIKRIGLILGGAAVAVGGWKVWQLYKHPDVEFLEQHRDVLDELAETIIPATDTPGAKQAEVGAFIIKMVRDCSEKKTQNNFINGLAALMDRAKSRYGKPFGSCSPAERTALLSYFEKEGRSYEGKPGKLQQRLTGESFYTTLKRYTVLGYCSSKAGATEAMRYDYIPGKYIASLPLQPGQRSWATQ